jgi:hypothetical protein
MARKPGVDVNALISAGKDNPALGDCRHEEYKLAENKPLLWLKIADQLKCEKSKYSISNCHRPSPSGQSSPILPHLPPPQKVPFFPSPGEVNLGIVMKEVTTLNLAD